MVSPQNPDPSVAPTATTTGTGRGFVSAEGVRPEVSTVQNVQGLVLYRSRISWGAVISGTLLSIALLLFSGSLAYACGVPAYYGGAYGAGAFIWSCITAAIAFFCGGCVAAYLVPTEDSRYDMLHGVMTWALALPLVLYILGNIGLMNRSGLFVNPAFRTPASESPGMENTYHLIAAGWGIWVSQAIGLIFAAIGGAAASSFARNAFGRMREREVVTR